MSETSARELAADVMEAYEALRPKADALSVEVEKTVAIIKAHLKTAGWYEGDYEDYRNVSFVSVIPDEVTVDGVAILHWDDYDAEANLFLTFDEIENIEKFLAEDFARTVASKADTALRVKEIKRADLLRQLEELDKED